MKNLKFMDDVWFDYLDLHDEYPKLWKRANRLIKESLRTPYVGIGNPEPLVGNYAGCWSRRISDEHRLIYKVEDDALVIYSCIGHYDD